MIKLEQPVIVEGKYDKITLENVIDALIIPTDGFGIFKDRDKCELIRTFAQKSGVIVMTDSDSAGNLIRSYLKKIVGSNGKIINVYVPQLGGKEKRKAKAGKEGILGVEGMSAEIIMEALLKSGVTGREIHFKTVAINKTDMFKLGLSGGINSKENRKSLLNFLNLPDNLSPNAMLDILNTLFTPEEFKEAIDSWQKSTDKN